MSIATIVSIILSIILSTITIPALIALGIHAYNDKTLLRIIIVWFKVVVYGSIILMLGAAIIYMLQL